MEVNPPVKIHYKKRPSGGYGLILCPATIYGKGILIQSVNKEKAKPELHDVKPFEYELTHIDSIFLSPIMWQRAYHIIDTWSRFPMALTLRKVPNLYRILWNDNLTAPQLKFYPLQPASTDILPQDSRYSVAIGEITSCKSTVYSLDRGINILLKVNDVDVATMTYSEVQYILENEQSPKTLTIRVRPKRNLDTNTAPPPPRAARRSGIPINRELALLAETSINYSPPRRRARAARRTGIPVNRVPEVVEISSDSDSEEPEVKRIKSAAAVEIVEPTLRIGEVVETPFGKGLIRQRLYRARKVIGFKVIIDLTEVEAYVQKNAVHPIGTNHLATYRPSSRPRVILSLTEYDYGRLSPGEYLNDTIIEFYLSYMTDHLSRSIALKQHIYSTFFFAQYRDRVELHGKKKTRTDAMDEAYESVAKWTKDVNIFEKRFLFVPVNETMHWSLAVVCNLDRLRPEVDVENQENLPCILILDSMRSHRTQKTAGLLRAYLSSVWTDRMQNQHGSLLIDGKTLPAISPYHIPRQTNNCDCGVFLLEYAQLLSNAATEIKITKEFVESRGREHAILTKHWFDLNSIPEKRKEIKKLIQTL